MADKRNYRDIVIAVETSLGYINNHLRNIDGHLEKINTTNLDQEVKILRNKDRISLLWKVGGTCVTIVGGGVAIILKLFGVY